MKKKIYTITWEHMKDQSLQIDYAEGINANEAIIAKLPVILLDPDDTHHIIRNAPRVGLVRLLEYLEKYYVKVSVRTAPGYEEVSRGSLQYLKGDATYPQTSERVILPHICNNSGKWGSGFVLAVSERWPEPERNYRDMFLDNKLKLGKSFRVLVEEDKTVVNMIAQKGIISEKNPCPISYDALAKCLHYVCKLAKSEKAEVHAPKFGSMRSGGNWKIIEEMIIEKLVDKGVKVFIYEFEE